MLSFQQLSLRRQSKLLVEDASLTIYAGFKVGLVGANGSGKTSLFKLILGELDADQGRVEEPPWPLCQNHRLQIPPLHQVDRQPRAQSPLQARTMGNWTYRPGIQNNCWWKPLSGWNRWHPAACNWPPPLQKDAP